MSSSDLSFADLTRKRRGSIEAGVGRWVSYLNREKKLDTLVGQKPVAPVAPKGLYLYGNVGSGKQINNFTWPACLELGVCSQVLSRISINILEVFLKINHYHHKQLVTILKRGA